MQSREKINVFWDYREMQIGLYPSISIHNETRKALPRVLRKMTLLGYAFHYESEGITGWCIRIQEGQGLYDSWELIDFFINTLRQDLRFGKAPCIQVNGGTDTEIYSISTQTD